MSHDRKVAKAKELETRRALGPRLGHAPIGAHTTLAPERGPRHKGTSHRGRDADPNEDNQ